MNILIAEDEPKTAKLLKELVEAQHAGNKVICICDSVEAVVGHLNKPNEKIDLFFMDIMLADGNSFEIFKQVTITTPVVFCTAYDDYTLAAFKNNGIDYILKPFAEKDIENVFLKIGQLQQAFATSNQAITHMAEQVKAPHSPQASFLVRFREKMYPVAIQNIAIIALENEIVYLYTFNGEKHPLFKPIDDVEKAVEARKFFRINRQMLVNRDAVLAMEPYFNRRVMVKTNLDPAEKPVVSRLKVAAFLNWLKNG